MSLIKLRDTTISHLKSRKGYLSIGLTFLIALVSFSCQSEKGMEKVSDPKIPETIWVSLTNETSAPISLRFQVGLNDSIQEKYINRERTDTLLIPLKQIRLLMLESKVSLRIDLLASPGDSLFIHLKEDGMMLKANREQVLVNMGESQFPSEKSSLQDSLFQLLVFTDSAQKMAVSNDYSKTDIYPIFFQKDFYQKYPNVLSRYSEEAYAEVNGIMNKLSLEGLQTAYSLSAKEELQLRRQYLRLSFLAKRVEDKSFLKKLLESPFFDEEFIMNSKHGETYLFFFITEGILKGEKRRSSNKVTIDYGKAYDQLDQHFSGPLLAKAKWFCIERMVSQNESYTTISTYATDYQNSFPEDTAFVRKFQENFLLSNESLVKSTVGLNLLLEDGSTAMLTGLLNDLRGKVVYIDYWASWCAPCRQAMPNSLALRTKLDKEDIVFVYFSVDNNQEAWKRASLSDGLENYQHTYLVLNHEVSQMKERLGIEAIPRYLIFDKLGRLVERNAPGPMDKNLEAILNKYITQ